MSKRKMVQSNLIKNSISAYFAALRTYFRQETIWEGNHYQLIRYK